MSSTGLSLGIIVAGAGFGTRLDAGMPKQYVSLLGIPMMQRTLGVLSSCPEVTALVLVVNPQDVDYCFHEVMAEKIEKVITITGGDEKRPLSVRNGLQALSQAGRWDVVGVHDAARPLVRCADIVRVVEALAADATLAGAILGIPSSDTIKVVDDYGYILSTPERRRLWRAQTPQIFRWEALIDAFAQPEELLLEATDDASLVEARGGRVKVIEGSPENFKITDRADLRHAEQILAERRR